MILMSYVVILYSCFKPISTFLNHNEMQISFDLIRTFGIRQCILVGNKTNGDLIINVKKFSSENIPITYLDYNQLIGYMDTDREVYFHTGLILNDENLVHLKKILPILEQETYKLRRFVWLAFVRNQTQDLMMIPYDCEFILIHSESEKEYLLTEIYSIKSNSFSLDFGKWGQNGLKISNFSFYDRRSNFQKSEMTVLFFEADKQDRFLFTAVNETLHILAYMMNFTIHPKIKRLNDKQIIQELNAFGDILHHAYPADSRLYFMDNLGPILKVQWYLYLKYPRGELRPDYYLQPFGIYLWLLLLSTILAGTVLSVIDQNFIPNKKRFFTDGLFLGLETFCNQCGNDNIDTFSLRSICIWLRLTAIISISAYGAVITSFLAVEILKPPFTNLKGFLDNGQYRLLDRKHSSTLDLYFDVKDNPLWKLLHEDFTKTYDSDHGLDEICYGKYVTYAFKGQIEEYGLPCAVFQMPEPLRSTWYQIILQKHSPFTKVLNRNYVRFYECGILKIIGPENFASEALEKEAFRPVAMEQMTQVLSLPLVGILLGMGIIVMEILIKRL